MAFKNVEKKIISGIEFGIENPNQILNMGGPWIGLLSYNNALISSNCFVDSFLMNNNLSSLYFVKYHKITKWQADNYFTINFYNLVEDQVYEFESKFRCVFIKAFVEDNKLEIFHAFHDKIPEYKALFSLDTPTYKVNKE